MAVLREVGVPSIKNQAAYINKLATYEKELGTATAGLIGLHTCLEERTENDLVMMLKTFDEAYVLLNNQRAFHSLDSLERGLNCRVRFSPYQNDLQVGLSRLTENLEGKTREVSCCVVGSAMFALLALRAGLEIEAGYNPENFHALAVVPGERKFFDVDQNYSGWHHFRSSRVIITGSPFLFIPSLIIFNVDCQKGRKAPTGLLQQLALAETINPYYVELYKLRSSLLKEIGDLPAARQCEKEAKTLELLVNLGSDLRELAAH